MRKGVIKLTRVLIIACLLCSAAFYNRFPLFTAHTEKHICVFDISSRSSFLGNGYFFLVGLVSCGFTLWPVIFLQSVCISYLLVTLFERSAESKPFYRLLIFVALSLFFTPLSLLVSSLDPSVFFCIGLLATYLLFIPDLTRIERSVTSGILFLALVVSNQNVLLGIVSVLLFYLVGLFPGKKSQMLVLNNRRLFTAYGISVFILLFCQFLFSLKTEKAFLPDNVLQRNSDAFTIIPDHLNSANAGFAASYSLACSDKMMYIYPFDFREYELSRQYGNWLNLFYNHTIAMLFVVLLVLIIIVLMAKRGIGYSPCFLRMLVLILIHAIGSYLINGRDEFDVTNSLFLLALPLFFINRFIKFPDLARFRLTGLIEKRN